MRLSKNQGKTVDPKTIFDEYEQRVFSMLKIQDLLYHSKNKNGVNVSDYINALAVEFRQTHNQTSRSIILNLEKSDLILESKKSLHLGLVVTEIFLNYFKHSFLKDPKKLINIELKQIDKNKIVLKLGNDNEGFDFNEKAKANTLGLPLIKDLAEGFSEKVIYPTLRSNYYVFEITAA